MNLLHEELYRQRCENCRDCVAVCRATRMPGYVRHAGIAALALVCALSALLVFGTAQAADAALPSDSIYHVRAHLTDSRGQPRMLSDARGHVHLASMFYATCPYVCPMIVEQLRAIERQLDAGQRDRLRVLLVTLEAEKDTPDVLARVVEKRGIDGERWTLAQPRPDELRELSAVLGVQYRKLPDGNFNHSSVITLFDADGRVLARTSKLGGEPDAEFVDAVKKALGGA